MINIFIFNLLIQNIGIGYEYLKIVLKDMILFLKFN